MVLDRYTVFHKRLTEVGDEPLHVVRVAVSLKRDDRPCRQGPQTVPDELYRSAVYEQVVRLELTRLSRMLQDPSRARASTLFAYSTRGGGRMRACTSTSLLLT